MLKSYKTLAGLYTGLAIQISKEAVGDATFYVFKVVEKTEAQINNLIDKASEVFSDINAAAFKYLDNWQLQPVFVFTDGSHFRLKGLYNMTGVNRESIKKLTLLTHDARQYIRDKENRYLAELEIETTPGNKEVIQTVVEGEMPNVNRIGKLTTRVLDATSDLNIVNRVKVLRQKLTSDFKRSGNFGWAETEVSGLSKSEYYAHSGIDEFGTGDLINRVPDISLKPQTEIFPWSTVPNSAGYPIARNIDTEYKILNEIADKLGSNTNATGKIRLFTERAPCSSCSNVINLFSEKYTKIEIEIIHNNGILLTNF